MEKDQRAEIAKLWAETIKQIIINWVTLKPIFKRIFSVKFVFITLIVIYSITLLNRLLRFMGSPGIYQLLGEVIDVPLNNFVLVIQNVFFIAALAILLKGMVSIKRDDKFNELKRAKKLKLIDNHEFRIKKLEIDISREVDRLRKLRIDGVITKDELTTYEEGVRKRFEDIMQFEKLQKAKKENIISQSEFEEKIKHLIKIQNSDQRLNQ